jgi:hypothetical protein
MVVLDIRFRQGIPGITRNQAVPNLMPITWQKWARMKLQTSTKLIFLGQKFYLNLSEGAKTAPIAC